MALPKYFTTVTPFSKYLAMALFIIFPFVSFYLGTQYQKMVTPSFPPTQYIPSPHEKLSTPQQMPQIITPLLSCKPRPACLDAKPRCMIPETNDMCPPATPSQKTSEKIFCTMEAKQCSNGSYVGRSGPKCEFAPCPK